MKKTFLISFFLFFIFTLSLAEKVTDNVNEYFLKNGLKVIIKENHNAPLVYVGMWYRVGNRNEHPGIYGIAHFLEHMLFRSTKNIPGGDITKTLTELGGMANGWTSYDTTAYWEVLPSTKLDVALNIEKERMINALVDKIEFEKERNIVLSELNNNRNSPYSILNEKLFTEAFPGLPLGEQFNFDKIKDLENLKFEDMVHFYRKYYNPENAFLIIVGDIETKKALQKVKYYFESIPRGEPVENFVIKATNRSTNTVVVNGIAPAPFGTVIYYAPPANISNRDFIVLSFIDSIELVDGLGYYATPDDTVAWNDFGGKNPFYISEMIDEDYIRTQLPVLKNKFFNKERIEYSKLVDIAGLIGGMERRGSYRLYDLLMEEYKKITPEDVLRVINKYLNRTNAVTGIFDVKKGKNTYGLQKVAEATSPEAISEDQRKEVINVDKEGSLKELIRYRKEVSDILKGVQEATSRYLKDLLDTTLENGLRVIIKERHQNELLSIRFSVPAGIAFEPSGKPHLAEIVSYLVFDGGPFVREKNNLSIEGASIRKDLEIDYATLSIDCTSDKIAETLDMLSKSILERQFIPLILEMKKNNLKRERIFLESKDYPGIHAERNLNKILYPETHPLRIREEAVASSYDSITMDDVVSFYRRYYRANGSTLIIIGDVKKEETLKLVQKYFSKWNRGEKFSRANLPMIKLPEKDVKIKKNMPGKNQTIILFGAPGIDHNDPLYIANIMLSSIVGSGGFLNSRLARAIRVEQGLSYNAEAWFETSLGECPFKGYIQTAPQNRERVINIFKNVLKETKDKGIFEKELLLAKVSLLSRFANMMETIPQQADFIESFALYRNDPRYITKYLEILKKVSQKEVNECARRFLHPDNLYISIAGPE